MTAPSKRSGSDPLCYLCTCLYDKVRIAPGCGYELNSGDKVGTSAVHCGMWERGTYLHSFLTSTLDRREWLASRLHCFILDEIPPLLI